MSRRTTTEQPVEMVEAIVEQAEEAALVVEEVEESKPKGRKVEPRECECSCGQMSKGGRFIAGHDMKLKSALLVAFDAGDEAAGAELVERGWRTEADLAARRVDGPKARQAASAEAKRAAKVERLDAKIEALTAERAALSLSEHGDRDGLREAADVAFSTAAAEVEGWVDGIEEPDPAAVAERCREAAGLFLVAAGLHDALASAEGTEAA